MTILLQSDFGLFLGRFHPLVVHLPIGFLLLAAVFQYLKRKPATSHLDNAIAPTLLLGALAAVLSVIFGLMLASDGGYEGGTLFWHKWLGILVAGASITAWLTKRGTIKLGTKAGNWMMGGLVALLFVTGHLGGNLTHGSGYLLQHAPGFVKMIFGAGDEEQQAAPGTMQLDSVVVYADLVQPVLEQKCFSCHNEDKQKGGLVMNTVEGMMEGGDHGAVLEESNAIESELLRRVTLPTTSKLFMPPKGNPMTFDQIKVLEWWINSGTSFEERLVDIDIPKDIKVILLRSFGVDSERKPYVEMIEVEPVAAEAIAPLEEAGLRLVQLAENNNLVEISAIDSLDGGKADLLLKAKEQITWLNFGKAGITDDMLKVVGQLPNLTRLRLEKNQISDAGIQHLTGLKHLESLNLYATPVTDGVLESIRKIPSLKRLYLWQTQVTREAAEALQNDRPDLEIDMGFEFAEVTEEGTSDK